MLQDLVYGRAEGWRRGASSEVHDGTEEKGAPPVGVGTCGRGACAGDGAVSWSSCMGEDEVCPHPAHVPLDKKSCRQGGHAETRRSSSVACGTFWPAAMCTRERCLVRESAEWAVKEAGHPTKGQYSMAPRRREASRVLPGGIGEGTVPPGAMRREGGCMVGTVCRGGGGRHMVL